MVNSLVLCLAGAHAWDPTTGSNNGIGLFERKLRRMFLQQEPLLFDVSFDPNANPSYAMRNSRPWKT